MTTISVLNQKGGVGKTTTTVNLAAALEEFGYAALVVDLDSQMNATSWVFRRLEPKEASIYDALDTVGTDEQAEFRLSELIEREAVDLVPSSEEMAPDVFSASVGNDAAYPLQLQRRTEELAQEGESGSTRAYDYCLLDCPPSLSKVVVTALSASEEAIVPLSADRFSMEGLMQLSRLVDQVRGFQNPDLEVMGLLPNNLDHRSSIVDQIEDGYREEYGDLVFGTSVPWRSAINEATTRSQTVIDFRPSSEASQFYRTLAQEVIERDQEA